MVTKRKEDTAKALEEAEAAAEETGTLTPVLEPDKIKTPEPGTTPDLDVINTDEAKSLNPNVVVSGTKPDGQGGQQLLDVVDPAVANAGHLPKDVLIKPQNPSEAPEDTAQQPGPGQVLFETTADNQPFWTGGPLKQGEKVVMSKEEAELLVQTKAGRIVSSDAPAEAPPPPPKASAKNAKPEGADVE